MDSPYTKGAIVDFGATATQPKWSAIAVVVGALAALPLILGSPTWDLVLAVTMSFAIVAVGADVVMGYGGQSLFGQFALAGIAAYTATILRLNHWVEGPLAFLICLALVGLVAALIGTSMVRLPHLGAALVTLFLAYLFYEELSGRYLASITGGTGGLLVPQLSVEGHYLTLWPDLYYLTWLSLAVTGFTSCRFIRSRSGRALMLTKRSVVVARSMGINTSMIRVKAFVWSSVTASIGGFLYASIAGDITPHSFSPTESLYLFAMVAVGGVGSLVGPILGAFTFEAGPELLQGIGPYWAVLFGMVVVVVVVAYPTGMYGLYNQLVEHLRWRDDKRRKGTRESTNGFHPKLGWSTAHREKGLRSMQALPAPIYAGGGTVDVEMLSVRYSGVEALRSVNVRVSAGEIHAIAGLNGAGKTSLLDCISGVQANNDISGVIRLDGIDITAWNTLERRRAGLARSFQHASLAPDLSALDNVRLGLFASETGGVLKDMVFAPGVIKRDRQSLVASMEILAAVGVTEDRWVLPAGRLTSCEQKLVDVARGLVGGANVILLDEPSAGVDRSGIDTIVSVLERIRRDLAVTVVVVTHDLRVIRGIADRVTVLAHGDVVCSGATDVVLGRRDVIGLFSGSGG